ncbi:hypothetical protein [Tsuneonella sp. HG222]
MSNIPNSAMPHAWAEDSPHAREVRRARGEESGQWSLGAKIALGLGLGYIALKAFGR